MVHRLAMLSLLIFSTDLVQGSDGRKIDVRGVTVLSAAEVDAVTNRYLGSVIYAEDIAAMINEFNKLYIAKGYINSGMTLPEQPDDGTLILQAIEGELTQVEVANSGRLSKNHIAAVIRREAGSPLNINELQSAFSRLEREDVIASVKGRLEPGDQLGQSTLRLDVSEADAFSASFAVNNYRSPSVGSEQAQAQLKHINLTGHGDVLSLGVNYTEGMDSGNLSYSLPVSALNSRLSVFYSTGDTVVVEAPFDAIELTSKTSSTGFNVETQIIDSLTQGLSVNMGLEKKTNDTGLLGLPFDFAPGSVDGKSRATVLIAGLSFQQRSRQQAVAAKVNYRQGIDAMDATISNNGAPDGEFSVWQLQLSYVRLLQRDGYDWTIRMAANSQFTNDTLQAFERYALGGHQSIRGYRENQVLRDESWEVRAQLEIPIFQSALSGSAFTLYPFYDAGKGKNAMQEDNVRQSVGLSSVGLGLNYEFKALRVNLEWAKRLDEKSRQGNSLQDRGIHVGVSYAI